MVLSMTGFGRAETEINGRRFSVEVRSVNSRFLEFKVRLPRRYQVWEEHVRPLVQTRCGRGRVDVLVVVDGYDSGARVTINRDAARRYHALLQRLKAELGLDGPVKLSDVVSGPDMLVVKEESEDLAALWVEVEPVIGEALDGLVAMRRAEGRTLAEDLLSHLGALDGRLDRARTRVDENSALAGERLKERLEKWLGGVEIDPERLIQEVAIVVDRLDVSEELVRAGSHIEQFRKLIETNGPVGRKLEFLLQELHREVNTLGSKSADVELSQLVVDMKSDLERLREQIQNVE
ncbi:MAG: YicC family protein [Proteobacteria bacterium]|nr:YicC family protein [Pseudomonadota bacterium]MBU1742147.1 YicC family protein [Pseudomonadota bacterium]